MGEGFRGESRGRRPTLGSAPVPTADHSPAMAPPPPQTPTFPRAGPSPSPTAPENRPRLHCRLLPRSDPSQSQVVPASGPPTPVTNPSPGTPLLRSLPEAPAERPHMEREPSASAAAPAAAAAFFSWVRDSAPGPGPLGLRGRRGAGELAASAWAILDWAAEVPARLWVGERGSGARDGEGREGGALTGDLGACWLVGSGPEGLRRRGKHLPPGQSVWFRESLRPG